MSAPKPYDPFLRVLQSANDCFLAGMGGTKAAVRDELVTLIFEICKSIKNQLPLWEPCQMIKDQLRALRNLDINQLTNITDSAHPEDFCGDCGRPNITWFAPSELWNKYAGDKDIICPVCFVKLAIDVNSAWELKPEFYEPKAVGQMPVTARSGMDSSSATSAPAAPDQAHYPDEAPTIRKALRALMEVYDIHTITMLLAEATAEILAEFRAEHTEIDHER